MYLLNIEAQKTSETFTGCLSFILKMIQGVLDAKLQVESWKSLIFVKWKRMYLFNRECLEKSKNLTDCSFSVSKMKQEIADDKM